MKKLLTLYFIVFVTASIFAQNQGINYKAVVKDSNGNLVTNQTIDMRFTIFEATTSVYQEYHTDITDANGIIILNIGEGNADGSNFSTIDWASNSHKLKVEIDLEQDATFIDFGTTDFKAVPYALHAKSVAPESINIDDLEDGKSDSIGSSLFLGVDAGANDNGTSNRNLGLGRNAIHSNTSGADNTAIGYSSLYSNISGNNNTASGIGALYSNTTGDDNSASGIYALYSNISGNNNTAFGNYALYRNISGNNNTAFGMVALDNSTGSGNVALGYRAAHFETGSNKLYIANSSTSTPLIYGEFDNDVLGFNGDVAIGHQAPEAPLHVKKDGLAITRTITAVLESSISDRPTLLFSETENTDITSGMSLEYNGTGSGGDNKMVFNAVGGLPLFEFKNSGDLNILNGDIIVNNDNEDPTIRMIDFNGNADRVMIRQITTNDVYIGDVDANNGDLILRADGSNVVYVKDSGKVGIGTAAPTRQLQLSTNSAGKPGSATWDVTSDRRLKKDIKPFNHGLQTLKDIDPVWFTYNGLGGMPIETGVGTIAQDLQKVAPYLIKDWIYTDDNGRTENYLGVNYGPLTFIMVNAIKEQAQEIEDLKAQVKSLKTTQVERIERLEARLASLEN